MILASHETTALRLAFKTALDAVRAADNEPDRRRRHEHLSLVHAAIDGRSRWLEGRIAGERQGTRELVP
jgi:hypothetical protein